MAMEDVPKFPRKYKPRGDRLVQRLEQNEISVREILNNIFSALGNLTFDSSGIRIEGEFGSFAMGSEFYDAMIGSVDRMIDYTMGMASELIKRRLSMVFKEREEHVIYLKLGGQMFRFRAHPLFVGVVRVKEEEINTTEYPLIEIIPTEKLLNGGNPTLEIFKWYISNRDLPSMDDYLSVKLYRIDQVPDWFEYSWEDAADMLDMVLPMTDLMAKETLDRLGESYPEFWDDVFTKCGV